MPLNRTCQTDDSSVNHFPSYIIPPHGTLFRIDVLYIREQAALLDRALQSILVNQSVKPSELVLVEDGPLTDGLYHVIDKYRQIFPELISVKLPQNGGLGNALNAE